MPWGCCTPKGNNLRSNKAGQLRGWILLNKPPSIRMSTAQKPWSHPRYRRNMPLLSLPRIPFRMWFPSICCQARWILHLFSSIFNRFKRILIFYQLLEARSFPFLQHIRYHTLKIRKYSDLLGFDLAEQTTSFQVEADFCNHTWQNFTSQKEETFLGLLPV